jgi:hypothetical protein
MKYTLHNIDGIELAEITEVELIISTSQQFLDLAMNIPANGVIIHKQLLDESFFDLRSGLAGEILQKVVNYRLKLGIVGDFSGYESKALRDMIYESNKRNTIVFVNGVDEALRKLGK